MLRDEKVYADEEEKLEERISHEPLGVIANISAWNYPYFVGGNVFIPALIAGNAAFGNPAGALSSHPRMLQLALRMVW